MSADMWDLFDGIVAFVYVAREGSFRGASQELDVTAAAVSKAVSRLEERLGVRLLHRTTRAVSLSVEGRAFLEHCQDAVSSVRTGLNRVEMLSGAVRGDLCVSLSPVFAGPLADGLPRFLSRYPSLTVEVDYSDALAQLVEQSVDVAVRIGELADSRLRLRKLLETRWIVVGAPSYFGDRRRPGSVEELYDYNCLRYRTPSGDLRNWDLRVADEVETVEVNGNLVSNDGVELLEAARRGVGLFQAFEFLVADDLASGRLERVLPEQEAPGPPVFALFLAERRDSPRVRAFLDFLQDTLN
jgi:DNA-binding transcriptional LysR family regulator